jgi:hypothetical protein
MGSWERCSRALGSFHHIPHIALAGTVPYAHSTYNTHPPVLTSALHFVVSVLVLGDNIHISTTSCLCLKLYYVTVDVSNSIQNITDNTVQFTRKSSSSAAHPHCRPLPTVLVIVHFFFILHFPSRIFLLDS